MIVVSDTSPINNLAAIGQLGLLQQVYGNIIIPPTVYQEHRQPRLTQPRLSQLQGFQLPQHYNFCNG